MKQYILGIVAATGLAACAGVGPQNTITAVPAARVFKYATPAENTHAVEITRKAKEWGSLCQTKLYLDDELVAEIAQNEATVLYLPLRDMKVTLDTGRFCTGAPTELPAGIRRTTTHLSIAYGKTQK